MAIIKSRIEQRQDLSQNFKRRKFDVGREFPDGSVSHVGPLHKANDEDSKRMSLTTPSKNEEDSADAVSKKYNASFVDNEKAMAAHTKMKEILESREIKVAALDMFYNILNKVLLETKERSKKQTKHAWNASCATVKVLFEQEKWVFVPKKIGPICGVEIGDKFQSRVELKVVGLHHQFIYGIDYKKIKGETLATSIIASGRYDNDLTSSDSLIYCGQGGNPLTGCKQPSDQRLERGNLALINSKKAGVPVRVIYGLKISKNSSHFGMSGKKLRNSMYVYNGLYNVDKYWQERGKFGKLVFKFSMKRIYGQPNPIFGKDEGKRGKSEIRRGVVSMNDISEGKEKVHIRSINALDEEKLMCFDYITGVIYPKSSDASLSFGCNSINGCENEPLCVCLKRNEWPMPYDSKGRIISSEPLIYECCPWSKCPLSCINRVSQNGITFQLEVFRTKLKRWGVRSRSYIMAGSFVCEYIGEVLHDEEVKKRIESTYHNRSWQGGTLHILSYSLPDADNFTIDATIRGNVGRFVNHCDSPNLRAQYVLYDHLDVKVPHMMLFANKDIPPFQEFTIDYSYTIAKFGM